MSDWEEYFAWLPVYFNGKWHWWKRIERRRVAEVDFAYYEYREISGE